MAGYDPKRTRPPAAEVDLDEPAPVDALLSAPVEPEPAPDAVAVAVEPELEPAPTPEPVAVAVAVEPEPTFTPAAVEAPIPVDIPVAPAPDRRTARLAIVGGVAAATVVGIALFRRLRRR